jgi:GWxTD domain-containing protein
MKKLLVLLMAIAVAAGVAQKTDKKKEAALRKELSSPYDIWLNQDVAWIITSEEQRAFHELATDEEREQFVEQFWLRRDPTPETVENEYKEEHYRRIAYANEHFASGVPGWRTDRGRIYIRFGAPDEIESHPSGGTYERSASQGGGQSSAFPFEIWRYRHLDNVGEDISVEFVDTTMSGEYHLTIDPCEKDALTYVPNAGLTLAEQQGLSTKQARFQNTDGTHCGAPLGGKSANDNAFTRMETLSNLEKPPSVKFRDLEAALVTSHINYNALPMQVRVDYLRVTDFSVMTNITVQFENRDLQFQAKDGIEKARVNLAGHVSTQTHRQVSSFEKSLEVAVPSALLQQASQQRSVWQTSVPLAPGKYKLEFASKDLTSGAMTVSDIALDVPRFAGGELGASSVILADTISRLPTKSIGGAMFAIGDTKVRPRVDNRFTLDEKMGIYFEIYNAASPGHIGWEVLQKSTGLMTVDFSEEYHGIASVEKLLPLRDFVPGDYLLRIHIDDGAHTLDRSADFTVAP